MYYAVDQYKYIYEKREAVETKTRKKMNVKQTESLCFSISLKRMIVYCTLYSLYTVHTVCCMNICPSLVVLVVHVYFMHTKYDGYIFFFTYLFLLFSNSFDLTCTLETMCSCVCLGCLRKCVVA